MTQFPPNFLNDRKKSTWSGFFYNPLMHGKAKPKMLPAPFQTGKIPKLSTMNLETTSTQWVKNARAISHKTI